jgi:hypothetical protein
MNEPPKKIRIITKVPMIGMGTKVWIDDVQIPYVRNVEFNHLAGDAPKVLIEIVPKGGFEIEGEAEVTQIEDKIQTLP